VLRRLPIHFSRRPLRIGAWGRWAIAIATAVVLCGGTLYAADARYREALGPGLIEKAYTVGGGHRSVEHTSELQSRFELVDRLLVRLLPISFPYPPLFRSWCCGACRSTSPVGRGGSAPGAGGRSRSRPRWCCAEARCTRPTPATARRWGRA